MDVIVLLKEDLRGKLRITVDKGTPQISKKSLPPVQPIGSISIDLETEMVCVIQKYNTRDGITWQTKTSKKS